VTLTTAAIVLGFLATVVGGAALLAWIYRKFGG
jgi:hypothetical protein